MLSQTHVVTKCAPKLTAKRTFAFWRQGSQRRARAHRILSLGDQALQAKKRKQLRHDYCDALHEARRKVYMLAQELKDRFRKHSVEHYHNDII